MKVVYDAFEGRYSDNPRALYERMRPLARPGDSHTWLCDPRYADGFPIDVTTVPYGTPAARAALEEADLVIANTHLDFRWDKKPGAVYLQTWHGTPLKRIHHDVLWAPEGVLPRLDLDVARWDYLLSPNSISTHRLREAFRFPGEVLEVGYPRNDILTSPEAPSVRARVRASLGIADDMTAVLYTPTWRDDEFYADGTPRVPLALDVEAFERELGSSHRLLPRLHYKMTDRGETLQSDAVIDVSRHPDVHELYLAADVMITDYSSTMFDFAVTGKPLLFYSYDLESYRDSLRGFYFDFEPLSPGPVLQTSRQVLAALQDLDAVREQYAVPYAEFQRLFTHLEDGHAGQRLEWLFQPAAREAMLVSTD
ncbi:MAG: CDP-glycerol:poly(glycerophosphate) glycerophosphotransferase [uncultured Friedmanniella sp.]|uniref:CDP-glycerol:poly(Glycerophosphate) glycerophosphotransferase n=1 Tax=uncultured Friedmanniella sp. TaxID=335381 RepID=A0A6J4KHP6_9ACTN|nr:CDP-glycerol glycerophosphotransferase family protein [uncultured Friedmanniella sp.]CAA9305336.1 MAG: CDP-glycerol:poly(glycerophosphate) glycerophosphotransferase [uncultured Friedmanniella sp.]